jgi:hypothetical protein
MPIMIFRRKYTLRRRTEQTIVNGYASFGYADSNVFLNIQPLSADELKILPEGDRTVKRIKGYGADALISADKNTKTPGDLLFYDGLWYECKTCTHWLHTPLTHYESEFVALEDQTKQKPPGGVP